VTLPRATARWLRRQLPGEQIRQINEAERGVRAERRLITTDRRRLVLKTFPDGDGFGARECACYAQLAALAPALIAPVVAVEAGRHVLLEHVAHATDLFGAFAREDPERVLRRLGAALAELIASTTPAKADRTVVAEVDALTAQIDRICDLFATMGVTVDRAGRHRLMSLCRTPLAAPMALTQGDPAPSNLLFTSEFVRFVDFEYGAPRHALFDLAQWFVRIPLPESWASTLARVVGAHLVATGVFATDVEFDNALRAMICHAGLYMFSWLPVLAALEADRPWVGEWSVRRALLSTAHRTVAATTPQDPLYRIFADLRSTLTTRWPDLGTGAIDFDRLVQSRRR
jgi:Ser/Thr protein kinase RdoA (MazF antagonist)